MNDSIRTGILTGVISSTKKINPVTVCGNLRLVKATQLGVPYYSFCINPNIPENRNKVLELLQNADYSFNITLVISSDVLHDSELLAAIANSIKKKGNKHTIRISDEGYKLTVEDYNKLSEIGFYFIVDDCVDELKDKKNIILQKNIYKLEFQYAQPVLERRKNFNDMIQRTVFHINHPLSETEFKYLADSINLLEGAAIELDYFKPDYYEDFLKGLQRNGVNKKINIQLIGYLLEDEVSTYKKLQNYPYEIDVVYSTCHDMIDKYEEEPYVNNRLYYSQLEGSGKTSIDNYLNLLNTLERFENDTKKMNFSPLESAIYAKMIIDKEYIYDPDFENSNTDAWDNVNLSQIINHEVEGKKRAVCLGFSTLYSAMLRKIGIPMFRYSTIQHSKNIGRIVDEKYGVDSICVSDITEDLAANNIPLKKFTHFMLSPRDYLKYSFIADKDNQNVERYEPLTIADTLALPMEEYYKYLEKTKLKYETFYHPLNYDPMGYTARMLELMNINPNKKVNDVYETIYALCENNQLDGVPKETLLKAIERVAKVIGEDSFLYAIMANSSFDVRKKLFSKSPAIGEDYTGQEEYLPEKHYSVELLTPENVKHYKESLGDDRPIYYMDFSEYMKSDIDNNSFDEKQIISCFIHQIIKELFRIMDEKTMPESSQNAYISFINELLKNSDYSRLNYETISKIGFDNCCQYFKLLCETYQQMTVSHPEKFIINNMNYWSFNINIPGCGTEKINIDLGMPANILNEVIDNKYLEEQEAGRSDYKYAQALAIHDIYYSLRDYIQGKSYYDGQFLTEYRELPPEYEEKSNKLISQLAEDNRISEEEVKKRLSLILDDGITAIGKASPKAKNQSINK